MSTHKHIALVAPPANQALSRWMGRDVSHLAALRAVHLGDRCRSFVGENLGLHYVAAALRNHGIDASVIDGCLRELSCHDLARRAVEARPDEIALFCLEELLPEVQSISVELRREGFSGLIVAGGPAAITAPDYVRAHCPGVDEVFPGDAQSFALARSAAQHGALWRPLAQMQLPSRDDAPLAVARDLACGISSSRGCTYGRCSFCTLTAISSKLGYRWDARPPDAVASEFVDVQDKFGPTWISFSDEDFLGIGSRCGRARALAIAAELVKKKAHTRFMIDCRADAVEYDLFASLRDAGLSRVFVGIENTSPEALQRLGKGISRQDIDRCMSILARLGIELVPGYILFIPRQSPSRVLEAFRFYRQLNHYELGRPTSTLKVYAGIRGRNQLDQRHSEPWYSELIPHAHRYAREAMDRYLKWTNRHEVVSTHWARLLAECHHDLIEDLLQVYVRARRRARPSWRDLDAIVSAALSRFSDIACRYNEHRNSQTDTSG